MYRSLLNVIWPSASTVYRQVIWIISRNNEINLIL